MHPRCALDPSSLVHFLIFGPRREYGALGNMLARIVSSSHFGKGSGGRDMTICGSNVFSRLPNMYFLMDEILISQPGQSVQLGPVLDYIRPRP